MILSESQAIMMQYDNDMEESQDTECERLVLNCFMLKSNFMHGDEL